MPTYDYRCGDCGHTLEIFHSMKDKPKKKCPKCGKNTLERLIGTGAGILFKGSGFYETDYRSSSYKKGADAEKTSKEGGAKKDEKSGDAKTGGAKSSCGSGCGCAGPVKPSVSAKDS